MKTRYFYALLSVLCFFSMNAQGIMGDMDSNEKIDVSDINAMINTILNLTPTQQVEGEIVDNSAIVGTWFEANYNQWGFYANNQTNFAGAYSYQYIPTCKCILFYDRSGKMTDIYRVLSKQDGTMVLSPYKSNEQIVLYDRLKGQSGKDSKGREYVDMGLPGNVLWASWNVGASKPEEVGSYFAWGETKGYSKSAKHNFSIENYTLSNGSWESITKYNITPGDDHFDNKSQLEAVDDAATANWGSEWRMPTMNEVSILFNADYTWTEVVSVNGVEVFKVTSKKTGNYIYFPMTGYFMGNNSYDNDTFHSWSRDLHYTTDNAYEMYINRYNHGLGSRGRNCGKTVRAVRVAKN